MNEPESFFLVVEGIDGTGKTSIAHRIVHVLGKYKHLKKRVRWTFEPHDPSCAGLFIRQVLTKKIKNVPLKTLALAFALNRADHCDREIGKFLSRPKRVIVCDRYYLSSLVYQSGDGLSFEDVMNINAGARKPDLTVFLDASNKVCYQRIKSRREDRELFEKNLNDIKLKYDDAIEFLKSKGENIVRVNADAGMESVLSDMLDVLKAHGPKWLKIQQYPLPVEILPEVFTRNDMTVKQAATKFEAAWKTVPISNDTELEDVITGLREKVDEEMEKIPGNDASNLLMDSFERSGYRVAREIALPDIPTFELAYDMPLGPEQHGFVLFLGQSRRYDQVVKVVMENEYLIRELERTCHFLFLFDAGPGRSAGGHYDTDVVRTVKNKMSLSPSVCVIRRSDIARIVFAQALALFRNGRSFDFIAPEVVNRLFDEATCR